MSPRIPIAEGQSLISIIIGLCSNDLEYVSDCKELLLVYLQINPDTVNYAVDGLPDDQPLAFVIAKTNIGRQLLFLICGPHINEETMNYTRDGYSVLSYLSRSKDWRRLLYTEKNAELIIPGVFNIIGRSSTPAAIELLRRQPELLLCDHIEKIFFPEKLHKYFDTDTFVNLLASNTGITVMLKYRELRNALNEILQQQNATAKHLAARLDAIECKVLKNVLAKEAKELSEKGYDNNSNLFHDRNTLAGYISYQNIGLTPDRAK